MKFAQALSLYTSYVYTPKNNVVFLTCSIRECATGSCQNKCSFIAQCWKEYVSACLAPVAWIYILGASTKCLKLRSNVSISQLVESSCFQTHIKCRCHRFTWRRYYVFGYLSLSTLRSTFASAHWLHLQASLLCKSLVSARLRDSLWIFLPVWKYICIHFDLCAQTHCQIAGVRIIGVSFSANPKLTLRPCHWHMPRYIG